jgi:cysteine desulfurase/selenocysteine lyase
MVPHTPVDVKRDGIDFLAWSFHKMLAPVGVGALYCKREILNQMRPFHYGGDMIKEGAVSPDLVEYNSLPWKFTAGTPNILGTIIAGKTIELLIDMVLGREGRNYGEVSERLPERDDIREAMTKIERYERELGGLLLEGLAGIGKLKVYGPKEPSRRTCLASFNVDGMTPFKLSELLYQHGIESRAGCHCATLAHHYLNLDPPASCRISPYFYNDRSEIEHIIGALEEILSRRETRMPNLEPLPSTRLVSQSRGLRAPDGDIQ